MVGLPKQGHFYSGLNFVLYNVLCQVEGNDVIAEDIVEKISDVLLNVNEQTLSASETLSQPAVSSFPPAYESSVKGDRVEECLKATIDESR